MPLQSTATSLLEKSVIEVFINALLQTQVHFGETYFIKTYKITAKVILTLAKLKQELVRRFNCWSNLRFSCQTRTIQR